MTFFLLNFFSFYSNANEEEEDREEKSMKAFFFNLIKTSTKKQIKNSHGKYDRICVDYATIKNVNLFLFNFVDFFLLLLAIISCLHTTTTTTKISNQQQQIKAYTYFSALFVGDI